MLDGRLNITELNDGKFATAPLLLLKLMGDLAVLEEELRTAEDTMGQPLSTFQDPLVARLCRVGVSDRYVEDFIAWRLTLSRLITDNSADENQLMNIITAESTGLAVFAELIASLKRVERRAPPSVTLAA